MEEGGREGGGREWKKEGGREGEGERGGGREGEEILNNRTCTCTYMILLTIISIIRRNLDG